MILVAARAGVGFAYLPESDVSGAITAGEFVTALEDGCPSTCSAARTAAAANSRSSRRLCSGRFSSRSSRTLSWIRSRRPGARPTRRDETSPPELCPPAGQMLIPYPAGTFEMLCPAAVLRLQADPEANPTRADGLRWVPRPNARISVPALTIHITGDTCIPFSMKQIYRRRATSEGSGDLPVQLAIRASAHGCDARSSGSWWRPRSQAAPGRTPCGPPQFAPSVRPFSSPLQPGIVRSTRISRPTSRNWVWPQKAMVTSSSLWMICRALVTPASPIAPRP